MSERDGVLVDRLLERLAALDGLPDRERLRDAARRRLLDTALSWAVGATANEVAPALESLARLHGKPDRERWPPAGLLAALATTARWGEVDDIHLASCTTPGAAVCSTVVALASFVPEAPVGSALDAVIAGYEAMAFAGGHLGGVQMLVAGVWPSRLVAPLAAAATGVRLLGLDEVTARRALCLATLWRSDARLPEPARALSFGRAVVDGAEAAFAAASGIEAGDAVAGHLLPDVSPPRSPSSPGPAQPAVCETSVKPFCGARQTLAGVMVVLEVVADAGLREQDLEAIEVGVPPPHVEMVDRQEVDDRMDALTSLQCQIALALRHPDELFAVTRRPGLGSELQGLMARVKVRGDDRLLDGFPQEWGASVSVSTRTGSTFERRLRGTASGGLPSWRELEAKGERMLAAPGGAGRVAEMVGVARTAETAGDLGALASLALDHAAFGL